MKKIVIIALLLSIISVNSAFADCNVNYNNNTVTIDGKSSGNVGITVFYPNNWFSDIYDGIMENSVIAYNMQKKADKDGQYGFSFFIDGETGVYRYLISGEKKDSKEGSFVFVNNNDRRTIVSALNNATNPAEVCNKYNIELEIGSSILNKADISTATKIISACISKKPFDAKDFRTVSDNVKFAYQVGAIAAGNITKLNEIDGCFSFINKKADEWMKSNKITELRKKAIVDELRGSYSSFEEFSDKLIEKLVISVVEQPNGIENLKEVIGDFSDKIGVNSSKISNNIYNSVSGKKFSNLKALKDEIDRLSKDSGNGGTDDRSSPTGGGIGTKNNAPSITMGNTAGQGTTNSANTFIMRFEDIDSVSWAYEAIAALAREKIISGKSEEVFDPMGNVTREEFVKMLVGVLKLNPISYDGRYTDVKYGDWHSDYVMTATANNVCRGIGGGLFGVGQHITRQDMCVMIYNAVKDGVSYTSVEDGFTDNDNISDYAKEAVLSLAKMDLVHGNDNKEFLPKNNTTRAEAAVLLNSLKNYLEGGNN